MITLFLPEKVLEEYDDLIAADLLANRSEAFRNAIIEYLRDVKKLLVDDPRLADKLQTTRNTIMTFLDKYLEPERLDVALPKPLAVALQTKTNVSAVRYHYAEWRAMHPDDRRVVAHQKKYGNDGEGGEPTR